MLGIVYITGFGISLSGCLTCLSLASSSEEAFTEWGGTESVNTFGSLLRFYERCTAYDDFSLCDKHQLPHDTFPSKRGAWALGRGVTRRIAGPCTVVPAA